MPKAVWNGVVLAESEDTVFVEGNHYFPPEALEREYFRTSPLETICAWKGRAHYYDIIVDGEVNEAAAWFYPDPREAAARLQDRVAFRKGVRVDP